MEITVDSRMLATGGGGMGEPDTTSAHWLKWLPDWEGLTQEDVKGIRESMVNILW